MLWMYLCFRTEPFGSEGEKKYELSRVPNIGVLVIMGWDRKPTCVCVCMNAYYICMNVYVYACVCIYVSICICLYTCICLYMYVCVYVCICICVYTCVHTLMCVTEKEVGRLKESLLLFGQFIY